MENGETKIGVTFVLKILNFHDYFQQKKLKKNKLYYVKYISFNNKNLNKIGNIFEVEF